MMFYKTQKGFVVVSEGHSRHFERNFEWTEKFKITRPEIIYPKHPKKPYGSVSKKRLKECVEQTIKEFIQQVDKLELLIDKFKLFDKDER